VRASLPLRVATSAALSALFLVVYPLCQFITIYRADVPSFSFGWERHVPFVAAMILPYLSIDLFFITAPLLITDRRKLKAYVWRIVTAILVAGAIFLVFPLRFTFDRPSVGGLMGAVFRQFQLLDQPFNQLPSLHIALLILVGEAYLRRTKGIVRIVLLTWFAAIAVSPLLVFQHHAIDLLGGAALGLACLKLFPDERPVFERSWRIARLYLAATVVLAVTACVLGRSAWLLWWPVVALAVTAIGYLTLGPALYGKRDGRLPLSTRLLLLPLLLGQQTSLVYYARRPRAIDRVTDRLWIGRRLTGREVPLLHEAGVGAVVDLTCEFTEPRPMRRFNWLNVPVLDLTPPTDQQICQAVAFIAATDTPVYVHCKAGYSRTAVIAAAYLLASGEVSSVDEAVQRLKAARSRIVVRPEARRAIESFYATHAAALESAASRES
jgi:hypothetical protein